MARQPRIGDEVRQLKGLLAGLSLDTKLLRLEQALRRKDWSDQPRAPAGQSNGGQWIGGDGGTVDPDVLRLSTPQWARMPGAEPAQTREETLLEDGTRVLSIRIRAGQRDFDEQHAVTAPDGESRIFETLGATQTIRDGVSGEILGRSTFTANGAEPDATVQPAFLQLVPPAVVVIRAFRTLELAGTLFAIRSARRGSFGALLGMTVHEFRVDQDPDGRSATWVGEPSQEEFDAACPKNGQVQILIDRVAATIRASGQYRTPIEYGNLVRNEIDRRIKALEDPELKSDYSIREDGSDSHRGKNKTIRLDLYERVVPGVTCIYGYKTGVRGLAWSNVERLLPTALKHFPDTQRIMIIQVRPR